MNFPSAFTAILILVLASPLALAKPDCNTKPDHPSCTGDHDTPANATFLEYSGDVVLGDGLGDFVPYIDGEDRVNCKIGRGGLFGLTTSNRISGPRKVCLSGDVSLGAYCDGFIPLDRCLVAFMRTDPSPERGGVDLRLLRPDQVEPTGLFIQLYNNKQNFFAIWYDVVRVEAVGFEGEDERPIRWRIDTDLPGLPSADVFRIENNQYVDRIQCGENQDPEYRFDLPFHIEVELQ